MLVKTLKALIFLGLCSLTLGMITPTATSQVLRQGSTTSQKVYIQPHQLSLDSEGIYVSADSEAKSVNAVYHDNNGYYYKQKSACDASCGFGHTSVSYLGECADPACPYYYETLDW